jgi:ATP-dependent helicase/nuclease subunit A
VAREIAARIKGWLDDRIPLAQGVLRPSDILILVRRRGRLMRALVKALKDLHIPIAGVDRLSLHDALAVMDLVKLAEFCLLPTDDLTLATVLKGPLIRFSEDTLFALSYDRGPRSLWHQLKAFATASSPPPSETAPWSAYQEAFALLVDFREKASHLTPFHFFSYVLYQGRGEQKMIERLGLDAGDVLDEFLSLALAYEKTRTPSLQGFLGWMSKHRTEVKRNLEGTGRDEVRLLTVHGSKGLEAPVVILPDTVQPPGDLPSLLWALTSQGMVPCLNRPDGAAPLSLKNLKENESARQAQEYNRLLYVALTRAKERLYICGWQGAFGPPENSWYAGVRQAVTTHPQAVCFPFVSHWAGWTGEGWRLERTPPGPFPIAGSPQAWGVSSHDGPLPPWVLSPPSAEATRHNTSVTGDKSRLTPREGQVRGMWTHHLLEKLIPLSPPQRLLQGERWWVKHQHLEGAKETLTTVLSLLEHPGLTWLWAPEGLSEVALAGWVEEVYYTGRVDRLLVTPEEVVVIDFKTDQRIPPRLPSAYAHQLKIYAVLAQKIYDRPVRCAVLWTGEGTLTWWNEAPGSL